VDDQVEWLDDETVMYALPAAEGAPRTGGSDIWAVSLVTQAPPRMLVHHGYSPAMIRSKRPEVEHAGPSSDDGKTWTP
jgi:hypothetical protein